MGLGAVTVKDNSVEMIPFKHITLLGFGEVGQILAAPLGERGAVKIKAYDIDFAQDGSPQSQAARRLGVPIAASAADATDGADLIVSAVTAGSAADAADALLQSICPGTIFADLNSVAPETKKAIATAAEQAGARFVEVAVMAAFPPAGLRTPMLLGGPHAEELNSVFQALGLNTTFYSATVGRASSVKMCRSIMVKGLEALALECMLTARRYGVEQDVSNSLTDNFPGQDVPKFAGYLMSRALLHGRRRSEEMFEVAKTVQDVGLEARMSLPIAETQAWAAELGQALDRELLEKPQLQALLDVL